MKKVLQIKYCYSEQETNDFLRGLEIWRENESHATYDKNMNFVKYLSGITYLPKVRGEGVEKNYADNEGVTAKATVNSEIIAVVQYFTYTTADEE